MDREGNGKMKERVMQKMIVYPGQTRKDIAHFLKVYAFAEEIGKLEFLDARTQETLEIAAIVHDIACPLCRKKYGNTYGKHQEEESEALLREFFSDIVIDEAMQERIIFLVCHHHTYSGVVGLDWQILLEADFLVNADESPKYANVVSQFEKNVFRTKSGKQFLKSMYQ